MTLVEPPKLNDKVEGGEVVEPDERSMPRRSSLLIVGITISVLGLTLVLFLAYVFSFTNLRQSRSQHQLLDAFTSKSGSVPLSGKLPADGQPAAVLRIPSLALTAVVVQGSTAAETAKGPGLVTGTARPGTIGNAVVVGRSTTAGAPFRDLKRLKLGAGLTMSSGLGKVRYIVVAHGVAHPGGRNPASPVNRAQLTLLTANAPLATSDLYFVVAKQLTPPGADRRPKVKPPLSALGTTGDPSKVLPTFIFGILYFLSLLGTIIWYVRSRRQAWVIYVLTTPIILALALVWFQNLYLLLPSSF
jgi:sortase A